MAGLRLSVQGNPTVQPSTSTHRFNQLASGLPIHWSNPKTGLVDMDLSKAFPWMSEVEA